MHTVLDHSVCTYRVIPSTATPLVLTVLQGRPKLSKRERKSTLTLNASAARCKNVEDQQ